jgi:hypothetical protein
VRLLKWLLNVWTFGWYGKAIKAVANQQLSNQTAQKALDLAKNAKEVYKVAPPRYVFIQPFEPDNLHYLQSIKGIFEMPEMRFFLQTLKEDAVGDIKRGMPIGIAQKACGWLEGYGVMEAKAASLAQAYEALKAAENEAV